MNSRGCLCGPAAAFIPLGQTLNSLRTRTLTCSAFYSALQSPGLALLSGRGFRDKGMIWWKQGSLRQGCSECLWSKVSLTVCWYLLALGIVEDCYYLADLLKLSFEVVCHRDMFCPSGAGQRETHTHTCSLSFPFRAVSLVDVGHSSCLRTVTAYHLAGDRG